MGELLKHKIIFALKNWEEVIACSALGIMVTIAVINFFTRYVLQSPMTWVEELECICLVWTTFCATAACYKRNLHYGMDFLVDNLPFKAKVNLRRGITFINIFLFSFLFVIALKFVIITDKRTAFFRLSYKYIDLAAVLAFFSMMVYSLIYFIESFVNTEKYTARYVDAYCNENTEGERRK